MKEYQNEREAEMAAWAEAGEVQKPARALPITDTAPGPVYPFSPDKFQRGGFVTFPCILIDEVMPVIGPNSWRLLCFIIRKTQGWEKDADAISYSQIMEGIGVSSKTAVFEFIKELQGFRPVKGKDRKVLGWERVESLPELILLRPGQRLPNGTVQTTTYTLNPKAAIQPSLKSRLS